MAGLFSSPKPIPMAPLVLPVPTPPPEKPSEAATSKDEQNRRRRGRVDTIATSFRGVLLPQDDFPRRKKLLGE